MHSPEVQRGIASQLKIESAVALTETRTKPYRLPLITAMEVQNLQ
jgi:hypothetical protein